MVFTQSNAIEVKQIKGKGRGVCACRLIRSGEEIERVPVLVLPAAEIENGEEPLRLTGYCFEWARGKVACRPGLWLALQPLVPAQCSL